MAGEIDSAPRSPTQFTNTIFHCSPCGRSVQRKAHNQKYCAGCADGVNRVQNRENEARKRRAAGSFQIRSEVDCPRCGEKYAKINGSQRECPPCAASSRKIYERESKKKYSANAAPRIRNSPTDKARQQRYIAKHKERRRAAAAAYNDRNREAINEKARLRNRTEARRAWSRRWETNRRETDPKFRLNQRMSASLGRGLREGKAGKSWTRLAGYSLDSLCRHLERQFSPGMSWANIGRWHVDHRVPLAFFKFSTADDPDFRMAWALTNLQPLWNTDNWSKGAKRILLL